MPKQPRKTISEQHWNCLVGLCALADNHYDRLTEIERTIGDLLGIEGEPGDYNHISDMIWGDLGHNRPVELLERLNMEREGAKGDGQ